MNDKEIIIDLTDTLMFQLHRVLDDLPSEAMTWQPDPEANNIAVTVWHIARIIDDVWARELEAKPATDQAWFTERWAVRTRYDPRGIGTNGTGVVMGYTQAEVRAIPELSAEESLEYSQQACDAFKAAIRRFPSDALHKRAPGAPADADDSRTAYWSIMHILMDGYQHVGECKAIKAMWERQRPTSS
jgi:hypothetical protein